MTEALDLPIELVPGRSRLVAERQSLVFASEFAYKFCRRRRGILNLAEKSKASL
jgi:hypothetical protein